MQQRLNDNFDIENVESLLASDHEVIAQFSKNCYSLEILEKLDKLAVIYGNRLQIRFYSHNQSVFDFTTLESLPNASNIAIDCLMDAENFDALQRLKNLKALSIGIYNGLPDNLLSYAGLQKLEKLTLSESKNKKLDLSPIANFTRLRQLHITGFTKGINEISKISCLNKLSLSQIGNKQSLEFVNNLGNLNDLTIMLGGRECISEINNSSIKNLSIIRVRGLSDIELNNMAGLEQLIVEDQIRISHIDFTGSNHNLNSIKLINCKCLSSLSGLNHLTSLVSMRISRTALNIDEILASELPSTLSQLAFYGASNKQDEQIHRKLKAIGYMN